MIHHPLKEWRARYKHPRTYVAGIIGCTPTTIYNWETFAVIPTGKSMAKLVSLTGLSPADFYPPQPKVRKRA